MPNNFCMPINLLLQFFSEGRQDLADILEETWGRRGEINFDLVKQQVERGRAQFLRQ